MGAAFAYDTYTNPSKNNGVLGATLTIFRKPSLCIVFKRVFGITPGTYRKLRQPGE